MKSTLFNMVAVLFTITLIASAGVGAVIASVVYEMAAGIVRGREPLSLLIMAVSFAATCFGGVSAVYVVLFCIFIGLVQTGLRKWRAEK